MGKGKSKAKIGIYGGVFDPIHNGHLFLAQNAVYLLQLDYLYLVPCGIPSHKDAPVADASHRMTMAQLGAGRKTLVSDFEINRALDDVVSYSIDTVDYFRDQHGEAELCLLIGADNISEIPTWKNYRGLSDRCRIVATTRPGSDVSTMPLYGKTVYTPYDPSLPIEVLRIPSLNISSTTIRESVKKRLPIDHMVPDSVMSYIEKSGLYK